MLIEEHIKVQPVLLRRRCALAIAQIESQAEGIDDAEDEAKLRGRLAPLELIDPLAGNPAARGKLGLAQTKVLAPAADSRRQISNGSNFHERISLQPNGGKYSMPPIGGVG